MDIKIQNTHLNKGAYKKVNRPIAGNEFTDILDSKIREKRALKISKHAESRLKSRDLTLNKLDLKKLEDAVSRLEDKGARESLMLYKDMALLTSIENRTIITALDRDDMDLVTNIDSAIIIK